MRAGSDAVVPAAAVAARRARRRPGVVAAAALMALLVTALTAHQVRIAWSLGDDLSRRADPYSEADALRSGEGYAAEGLTAHHGLPDVLYGGRFPEAGMRTEPWLAGEHAHIYTHYPPGPNWIAGVMTMVWGAGRVREYRLAPLLAGGLALAFYAWALQRRLGAWRGLLLLALTALPRMTTLMMHGLHYQGYAQSLLLVQLGLLLSLLARDAPVGRGSAAALFLIGFSQGWLSFDHVFLVAGCAIPLWLATPDPAGKPAPGRTVGLLLLPAAGFAAAHLLHFIQVALELGGASAALADFRTIARWRADGTAPPFGLPAAAGPPGPGTILRQYLTQHVRRGSYFGAWAYLWLASAALLVTVRAARWPARWPTRWWASGPARGQRTTAWTWSPAVGRPRRALALLAALLVSAAWILLMRNHAQHHTHFLPRHFYLLYFTGMLLLVEGLGRDPAAELTPLRGGS